MWTNFREREERERDESIEEERTLDAVAVVYQRLSSQMSDSIVGSGF